MAYKSGLGYFTTGGTHQVANGDVGFFTVTGLIMVTSIYGVVTIVAAGASVAGFYAAGTGLTRSAWCVGADIDTALVGDLVTINSVAGTLTTVFTGVSAQYNILAAAGVVGMFSSAAQGTLTCYMTWIPMTDGSTVVLL